MTGHPTYARGVLFAALALSSAFCVGMLAVRPLIVGSLGHTYLVWNLFLAWIPFVLALVVYDRLKTRRPGVIAWLLGAAWLAFLPNAPYIVTDLIHIPTRAEQPLWFDVLLYLSFAWTGLLLGLVSLYLVHIAVRRWAGAAWGWVVAFGAMALSGFGIYLGRFLRWNSWDIIANPTLLVRDVLAPLVDPVGHARAVAVTVLFTTFLAGAYLVMYAFAKLRDEPDDGVRLSSLET